MVGWIQKYVETFKILWLSTPTVGAAEGTWESFLISFHDGDDDEDEEEEDNDDGNDDDDGVPPFPHHQDHEHPHNDDHDEEESHLSYQSELPHQDSQHVICISSSGCSRLVNYFIWLYVFMVGHFISFTILTPQCSSQHFVFAQKYAESIFGLNPLLASCHLYVGWRLSDRSTDSVLE